jgi:hypothetical protein
MASSKRVVDRKAVSRTAGKAPGAVKMWAVVRKDDPKKVLTVWRRKCDAKDDLCGSIETVVQVLVQLV